MKNDGPPVIKKKEKKKIEKINTQKDAKKQRIKSLSSTMSVTRLQATPLISCPMLVVSNTRPYHIAVEDEK